MTDWIDLRSDTVTRPSPAMRRAMAEAEVGDDVYGEDPTVRALEDEGAAALGQEAALFVPSGIMGNQIALRLLAPRGSELLCDHRAHVLMFEEAAMSALSGIQPRPLPSEDGLPAPATFRAALAPRGGYRVATGAIALENSHNVAGGQVYARPRLEAVLEVASAAGVPVHLDGARIWNAAQALDTTPAELARGFDTVMFCLSKGLGAPVGSLLCSTRDRIAQARQVRRQLGGGMRQVGVLAAAGRVALAEGPPLLERDHRHARQLAEVVARTPGLEIDLATVRTNIVIFRVLAAAGGEDRAPAARWAERARAAGVLGSAFAADLVRLVTHRDLDAGAIERAGRVIRELAA